MRINHNLSAMNTYRQMGSVQSAQSKSMEKLSSGYRINRAGDDAAGLAISEKMRGQIRGLNQASRNAEDGISLIQTAEGALNETESILQRMRELSVQASNDTNTSDDRVEIQKEIDQLTEEIDRISSTTEFNTKKLLNGSASTTASIGATNTALLDSVSADGSVEADTYTITATVDIAVAVEGITDSGTGLNIAGDFDIATNPADVKLGSYQLNVEDDSENAGMKKLTLVDSSGETVATANNVDTSAGTTTLQGIVITNTNITGNGSTEFDIEGDFTFTLQDGSSNTIATTTMDDYAKSSSEIGGISFDFSADLVTTGTTTVSVINNAVSLQIGANEGQTMNIAIGDMSSSALNVDSISVETADDAEAAITSIDDAISAVSSQRSDLGAYQNRLEHSINNLDTTSENLQASESRIRDVDMASEMMEYTKNNILQQAAQSMLAQANQAPQGVLQLLG